ncbi:MAG: hypothetical protein D6775_11465, partial [Caldilineae bacterium]
MNEERKSLFRTALRFGLLGGIVAFYISAIGMTETFSQRYLIGSTLSMGHVFITVGAIGAGIMTARAFREERKLKVLGSGLLAGLLSSIPLVILIFLIRILVIPQVGQDVTFRWRDMLVNFSPALVELLTFGQGLTAGIPILIVLLTVLAGLASALVWLPLRWRSAFISGIIWTLGVGVFSENVGQIVRQIFGRGLLKFMFAGKSLNPVAAGLIFVIAFGVTYFRVLGRARSQWQVLPPTVQTQGRRLGILLGLAFLLALPWGVGLFLS